MAKVKMRKIKRLGEDRFLVQSEEDSDTWYEVDLAMPFCECKGFYYTKKPCKHIKIAREAKRNSSPAQAAGHRRP